MVAPGTTAFPASMTVPLISALPPCAIAGTAKAKTMSDPVSSSETRLTMESSNPFDYFW